MVQDAGFDAQRQSHDITDQIQVSAWDGKEELKKATTLQTFSLHGLTESDVIEVPVVGGNRISMPTRETGRLTFNSMNLLTGILAGDTLEDGNKVVTYYPHVRDGELKGKTVFTMSLDEAAILLKKAAAANGIDITLLKHAVSEMTTRFSMFGQEQFDLHAHDVSMALMNKI